MKPTLVHRPTGAIEVVPNDASGWIVGTVAGEFVARTVCRLSWPAVDAVSMVDKAKLPDDFLLALFLERDDNEPHAYTAMPGVVISLKNPLDSDAQPIEEGSRIVELQPAVSTRA